jgi:hypothetical protein
MRNRGVIKAWRFKTRKEFESEFGPGWRNVIGWNFDGHMDYLCGTKVSPDLVQSLLKEDMGFCDSWVVRKANITPCSKWKIGFKVLSKAPKKLTPVSIL